MTSPIDSDTITTNIDSVLERMRVALEKSARSLDDVTLVAVSKRHPVSAIAAAYAAGLKHFGENRVAECTEKVDQLPADIVWHMVGSLQSRKASAAVPIFDWLHSLDRTKIARKLDAATASEQAPLKCLIQVNLSGEESKSGFELSALERDASQYEQFLATVTEMLEMTNLSICGLMTMAPFLENAEEVRPIFKKMRQLQEALQKDLPQGDWSHLSMGMTNDYDIALEEGATIVRLGTAIFGQRNYT